MLLYSMVLRISVMNFDNLGAGVFYTAGIDFDW